MHLGDRVDLFQLFSIKLLVLPSSTFDFGGSSMTWL